MNEKVHWKPKPTLKISATHLLHPELILKFSNATWSSQEIQSNTITDPLKVLQLGFYNFTLRKDEESNIQLSPKYSFSVSPTNHHKQMYSDTTSDSQISRPSHYNLQ